MRTCIIVITSFILSVRIFGQDSLPDTSKGLESQFTANCYRLQKQASLKRIGKAHSRPLIVANETVIRLSELQKQLLDSVFIIKCPQSFEKYGDPGALGIIVIKTRQTFKATSIGDLADQTELKSDNRKIIYALNGYFTSDTALRISDKAIKRIDIISGSDPDKNETTCISIWTITRKEIRQDNAMPKPCRGVGSAYTR